MRGCLKFYPMRQSVKKFLPCEMYMELMYISLGMHFGLFDGLE